MAFRRIPSVSLRPYSHSQNYRVGMQLLPRRATGKVKQLVVSVRPSVCLSIRLQRQGQKILFGGIAQSHGEYGSASLFNGGKTEWPNC